MNYKLLFRTLGRVLQLEALCIDVYKRQFLGTVEEIDMERQKVRVVVSMFGRETPVELDLDQIESI